LRITAISVGVSILSWSLPAPSTVADNAGE
jgi:hypothetical protein